MRGSFAVVAFVLLFGCASAEDEAEPSAGVPYWAAGSTTNEGKSTHLWIVNRSMAILAKHQTLPRAARAYTWLNNAACSTRWRLGLDEADSKVSYNNWWTWRSHFYDPSTGTNYLGQSNPVAYNEALSHLATARSKLAQGNVKDGCYELGLALHYATDMTMPMHAANFAATDQPLNLHSHLEDRAVVVQNQFTASDWTATPTGTVNAVLTNLSWVAHGQWTGTWNALANAVRVRCDDNIDDYTLDHTSCWEGDAGVDAALGVALRSAQTGTAAFLYAADLP